MTNKDIIKGFNQGYMLQKQRLELVEKLIKSMEGQKSGYVSAFIKGSEEWQKEKSKGKEKPKKTSKKIRTSITLKNMICLRLKRTRLNKSDLSIYKKNIFAATFPLHK